MVSNNKGFSSGKKILIQKKDFEGQYSYQNPYIVNEPATLLPDSELLNQGTVAGKVMLA
jgi:hypothetical protein